jgi:hypothetical protein
MMFNDEQILLGQDERGNTYQGGHLAMDGEQG